MAASIRTPRRRWLGLVGATWVVAWAALVGPVIAHAELVSSDPADGATVDGPFAGPIVLTYDEALASGSKADLKRSDGSKVAAATIDPADQTRLVFTLTDPLGPGAYTVAWTSIAADKDVERGTVTFTVSAPPTPSPSPSNEPTAAASPSASATPSTGPTASPAASPSPDGGGATGGADVLLPVIAALVAIAILGFVLTRNRRARRL